MSKSYKSNGLEVKNMYGSTMNFKKLLRRVTVSLFVARLSRDSKKEKNKEKSHGFLASQVLLLLRFDCY
jgi:hypothetical protein